MYKPQLLKTEVLISKTSIEIDKGMNLDIAPKINIMNFFDMSISFDYYYGKSKCGYLHKRHLKFQMITK